MRTRDFVYLKAMGERKNYNVLILSENETHLNGVALNYLSEEELTSLTKLQEKYEEDLKPYINKAFRQFLKNKIID